MNFCKIKFKKKHCIVEGVQLPHKGMLFYFRISLFFNRKILFVYCRSLLSSLISSANHGWVLVPISWTILNMVAWLLSAWVSPRAVLPMGLMLDGCSKYIAHLKWTMLWKITTFVVVNKGSIQIELPWFTSHVRIMFGPTDHLIKKNQWPRQ